MNLSLLTWNGHNINDGTSYNAAILPGAMVDLTNQAAFVDRAENFPFLSSAIIPAHSFTFRIILPAGATLHTLREQLKGWFNISDFTPHQLIAQDVANGNKQWQLTGIPVRVMKDPSVTADNVFVITLAVADPIWRAVSLNSTNWNVTATGQTQGVTNAGNIPALPQISITPTSSRTTQWFYERWCPIFSNSVRPFLNYPVDLTNGGLNTSTMINNTAVSNQINQVGGIGAGDVTIPINTPVGGGLPNFGMGFVGTEQISWTSNNGGTSLTGVVRGIGGTTAAAHANGSVIAQSKLQANGNDIRVLIDGTPVNYWLDGINTTTTKIWCNINLSTPPLRNATTLATATLRTALPNNGAAVNVQLTQNSVATNNTLKAMKASANNVFLIGSEAFTYSPSNVDLTNSQIKNCNRAQKFTSFAAHSVGVTLTLIEHDIWLLYGNQSAAANDTDNNQQPLLDLHNSTNTSWVQTQFYDSTAARPAAWAGQVLSSIGQQSTLFTGNQQAVANPATELGMRLLNYMVGNIWKAETATIVWGFYHPGGITTISMAGSKYAFNTVTWPNIVALQYRRTDSIWANMWNETVPGSAQTWTAITHNGVSVPAGADKRNFRVIVSGTISAVANNEADLQCDTITLALDSTQTPTFSLNTEQATGNWYYLNATITNNTTGDFITITGQVPFNTALTVDCVAKTITLFDGTNVLGYLTISTVRNQWLTVAAGANTFQYDDIGTGNATVAITFADTTL